MKVCSVVPQVTNGTGLVDSELFTAISNVLAGQGLTGLALRNATKEVYKTYQSKDFTQVLGDWRLYKSVMFNNMNSIQAIRFNSVYNGSVELLKNSIGLELDSNLEVKGLVSTDITPMTTTDASLLTGRAVVTFDNKEYLDTLAKNLRVPTDVVIGNILKTKDIHFTNTNDYITNQVLTEPTVTEKDTVGLTFGIGMNTAQDSLKLSDMQPSLGHIEDIRNVDDLSQKYSTDELVTIGKLMGSVLLSDIETLEAKMKELAKLKTTSYDQNIEIKKFIVGKLNGFRDSILTKYDELIKDAKTKSLDTSNLESVKNNIVKAYSELAEVINYNDPTNDSISFTYDAALAIVRKHYNIDIAVNDNIVTSEQADEFGNTYTEELNEAHWNDRDGLKVQGQFNIAKSIKILIAKSINTDYIDNIANNINSESKYGIVEPLSVSDVWNTFISIAANNNSKADTIQALKDVNKHDFNGLLTTFIKTLETDNAIWSSYYTSAVKAVLSINQLSIGTTQDSLKIVIANKIINYMAFSKNVAYGEIENVLSINLENNKKFKNRFSITNATTLDKSLDQDLLLTNTNHNPESLIVKLQNLSNNATDKVVNVLGTSTVQPGITKYGWIKNRIEQLGLEHIISMADINRYVMNSTKTSEFDVQRDPFYGGVNSFFNKEMTKALLIQDKEIRDNRITTLNAINSKYDSTFNELIRSLVYMSNDIASISPSKLKRANFKATFNQKGSITTIANIIGMKYYRNTSLGYYNENGDIEQTPQKPSFLSDFAKIFTTDPNNISVETLTEYFKDYLADPTMKTNTFLFGDTGLFKVDTYGKYEINNNFIKNFKIAMFSGVMYKDTNTGSKYESVTGDTWKIIKIQNALRGNYIIPSSDSGRSHIVTTPKYGLKHFTFDENGKYSSKLNMIKQLGIYESLKFDGTPSTSNREIDLNDDNTLVAVNIDGLKVMRVGDLRNDTKTQEVVNELITNRYKHLVNSFEKYITYLQENISHYAENATDDKRGYYEFIRDYKGTDILSDFISQFGDSYLKERFGNKNSQNTELATLAIHRFMRPDLKATTMSEYFKSGYNYKAYEGKFLTYDELTNSYNEFGNNRFITPITIGNTAINLSENTTQLKKSVQRLDTIHKFTTDPNAIRNSDTALLEEYSNFINSPQVKAFRKSTDTEIAGMTKAFNEMFDVTYEAIEDVNNPGQTINKLKTITPKKGIQERANNGELASPTVWSGKRLKAPDGKQIIKVTNGVKEVIDGAAILLDGTTPTGKIFQFNRMTFTTRTVKGLELMTLEKYAKNFIHGESYNVVDFVDLVARTNAETHPGRNNKTARDLQTDVAFAKGLFNKIYYSFLDEYLASKQDMMINQTKSFISELQTTIIQDIPAYVDGTYEGYSNNSKRFANLFSMHEEEAELVDKNTLDGTDKENHRYTMQQINRQSNRGLLEAYMNDYLAHINIGEDILFGRSWEYKGIKDVNKRVNQTIKNGDSNDSNHIIRSLTITDPETTTNMFDLLKENNGTNVDTLWEQYKGTVEVGNGLSMITVGEYVERLRSTNSLTKMQPYIDALTDPTKPFDEKAFSFISEQLKYYMYNRKANNNGVMKGVVTSYQEKNSTIVLFPKLFKGTTYEGIINWMDSKTIGELNFLSASKVGGQPVFKMHRTFQTEVLDGKTANTHYEIPIVVRDGVTMFDDRINTNIEDYSKANTRDVEAFVVSHKLSSLRIQQDTIGHIHDEEGKISTQMIKKMWNNMDDMEDYVVNGVLYKGRTGDYAKGNRGLFENFHSAMSINAEQDMLSLIDRWGGLDKDGEISLDADGNINLDIKLIEKDILDYFRQSADLTMMRALSSTGATKFSLHHPTIKAKIEELLQSRITKNVAMKLKQVHAPIMPDVFTQPSTFSYSRDKIVRTTDIQHLKDNSMVSFRTDFLESKVGKTSFELESEHYDSKGVFHPAQVITNIWDSKFDQYRTTDAQGNVTIDIDSIPKEARTMVCTRIPHEGMQSSFIAEVVGFMNNGASQVIVPKHLSKRTGWDYDIDTIYMYPKNLYMRNDELHPISAEWDNAHPDTAYNTHERKVLAAVKFYKSKEYNTTLSLKNKSLREARDTYNTTLANNIKVVLGEAKVLRARIIAKDNTLQNEKIFKDTAALLGTTDVSAVDAAILKHLSSVGFSLNADFQTYKKDIKGIIDNILRDEDISKETLDLVTKFQSIDNNNITYDFISPELNAEIKSKMADAKVVLKETIESIKSKFESDVNVMSSDETFKAKMASMSDLKQVSRETRDNMIVDTMIARIQSKQSTILREQPNEFAVLNSVSKGLNSEYGIDDKTANFADFMDRANIENINRDVAVMKAGSVTLDNNYAVLGSLGASTSNKMAIPFVVERSEFMAESNAEVIASLNAKVGLGNYILQDASGKTIYADGDIARVIVFSKTFANNAEGSWTNVNGTRITKFSSQITSNVLDAVKDSLGFNISNNVLNVMGIMANSPVSHYTDLYHTDDKGNNLGRQDNAFAYSNMLIHQAIVTEVLSQMGLASRGGEFADKQKSIRTVKNDIYDKLVSSIHRIDLLNGQGTSKVSVLDMFVKQLNTQSKDLVAKKSKDEMANTIKKVQQWITSINEGRNISMFDTTGISAIDVYNKFANFISNKELLNETIINNLSEEEHNVYKSEVANKVKDLSLSEISTGNIYNVDKKGNYTITKPSAFKTLTELHTIYSNSIVNGNYNIASKYEDLNSQVESDNKISFVQFLDDQLSILDMFQHIDNTASVVTKSSKILRTDKLGTSPNSEVTSKLFNDITDMHIDVNAFVQNMKDVGYTEVELNTFKNNYYKAATFQAKMDVINNQIVDFGLHKPSNLDSNAQVRKYAATELTEHKVQLFVGEDTSLVEAVFPSFVDNTMNLRDYDFTKSKYPYFEAQLVYANNFSTKAFNKVLLSENVNVKNQLDIITNRLNIATNVNNSKRAALRNTIITTMMNQYLINNVPFLNGGTHTDSVSRTAEILRVLGNVSSVKEIIPLNSVDTEVESLKSNVVTSTLQLDLEKFKTLSAANKVELIKSMLANDKLGLSIRDNKEMKRFLHYVKPQLATKELKDNGYHSIRLDQSEEDGLAMKQIFTKMYYSNSPFVREMAKDLIRYTFHTSGFAFGNNLSKWIDLSLSYINDIKLYSQDASLIKEMSLPINDFSEYTRKLNDIHNVFTKEYFNEEYTEELLSNIRSQMYDNNIITPVVSDNKKANQPKFKDVLKLDGKNIPIITELASKIANSRYSNNETLRIRIQKEGISGTYAMQRYAPENSTNVYYFPFVKQIRSVFSDDVIQLYRGKVESAQYYKDIIDKQDAGKTTQDLDVRNVEDIYESSKTISNDARVSGNEEAHQYVSRITNSSKTYSETAKDIVDAVDNILYIGENSHYRNSFKSDKTIYTTIKDINRNTLSSIPFDKPTSLAIVGDGLSDGSITQKEYDATIVPMVRLYQAIYNINSIKTIFKTGVGESIYKATFTNNLDSEYITIGQKDDIRNVTSLDEEAVQAFKLLSETTIAKNINKEVSAAAINMRLKQYALSMPNSHADNFNFDLDTLKATVAKMSTKESRFAGIMDSIGENAHTIDKILEFFAGDRITIVENGVTTSMSIFDADIYKYMSGRDIEVKTLLAQKLSYYKNLISVANEIMSLKTLTYPITSGKEFDALSDAQQTILKEQYREVEAYNKALNQMKNSRSLIYTTSTPTTLIQSKSANEDIERNKHRVNQVEVMSKWIDNKIAAYHGATITIHTRNPRFQNANFSKLVKLIIDDQITPTSEKVDIKPSAEQLIQIFEQAMMFNDDLTFMQMNMESVRDTGSALIDTGFMMFTELKQLSLEKKNDSMKELNKLLDDYGLEHEGFKYKESRMLDLRNKFIDPNTGGFIAKYERSKFNKEVGRNKYNQVKVGNLVYTINSKDSSSFTALYDMTNNKSKTPTKVNDVLRDYINEVQRLVSVSSKIKEMYDKGSIDSTMPGHRLVPIASFEQDGSIRDIVIAIPDDYANHTYTAKVKVLNSMMYVKTNDEYVSYTDLLEGNRNPIAIDKDSYDSSKHLGYYNEIPKGIGAYKTFIEAYHTQGMADNSSLRNAYEKQNNIKFTDIEISKSKGLTTSNSVLLENNMNRDIKVERLVPHDKFLSEKYKTLNPKDIEFLNNIKDIIDKVTRDVFPTRILADDTIPYIFLNSTAGIGKTFLNFIGWQSIQEEHVTQDLLGNTKHFFQANTLNKPDIKYLMKVPHKKITDTYYEHEKATVEAANIRLENLKKYNKEITQEAFKTYDEVLDYNDAVMQEFLQKNNSNINHDIPSVLNHFIEELYNIKTNVDFEHTFNLLLNTVASNDFQARYKRANGQNFVDAAYKAVTGQVSYVTKKGKDTELHGRLLAAVNPYGKVSRVNTKMDQITGTLLRYVSMNTMMLNVHTGIKNILQGMSTDTIEAAGKEYFSMKDFGRALNMYISNINNIWASRGQEESFSVTAAVLKEFSEIYEDHSEGKLKKELGGALAKITNAVEAVGYGIMTAGEHLNQMTVLLAMMQSHRLVNGEVLSKAEFINNRQEKVIRPLLNTTQIAAVDAFIEKEKEKENTKYRNRDFFTQWLRFSGNDMLEDSQKDVIAKAMKVEEDKATETFEGKKNLVPSNEDKTKFKDTTVGGFPTLLSMYKLDTNKEVEVDGKKVKNYNYGKLIIDPALSPQNIATFSNRVRAMNQKLHGIYNTYDRSALQNNLMFEAAFQFRKWMYSTWVNYMGSNFSIKPGMQDDSQFGEALGHHRQGIFVDFAKFIHTPAYRAMVANKQNDVTNPVNGLMNIFKAQINFLQNLKYEYALLNTVEKANVDRSIQFIKNTILTTAALFVAGAAYKAGGADEKKKIFKPLSWTVYNMASLQTEHMDLVPVYGWFMFYKRTKQNVVPVEKQIGDLTKLLYDITATPFRTEEQKVHKAGIYKDKSKIQIDLEKAIPMYRQVHKEMYMTSSIDYYNMANPIFNLVN